MELWNGNELRGFRRVALVTLGMVVALLALPAECAEAIVVSGYTIDVDVRTSWWTPISHAHVKGAKWGNQITISVYVPGYIFQERKIAVLPNIKKYAVTIPMPDKEKRLDVMDFNYKPIASAYFDRYQGGTPPDKYSVNLFLPIKSWPHPGPAQVKLNQPGYGWPIQESCEISVRDEFYRVRMIIDRAVLDDPNDELLVYVNTGAPIRPEAVGRWFADLRLLERKDPAQADELARLLIFSLPPGLMAMDLPASIACLKVLQQRFDQLHRVPVDRIRLR